MWDVKNIKENVVEHMKCIERKVEALGESMFKQLLFLGILRMNR